MAHAPTETSYTQRHYRYPHHPESSAVQPPPNLFVQTTSSSTADHRFLTERTGAVARQSNEPGVRDSNLTSPRPQSSGAASRVSNASSLASGHPRLRKKPKTISSQSPLSPTPPIIPEPPIQQVLDQFTHEQLSDAEASFYSSHNGRKRANSSTSLLQSPVTARRPPASHSSYGIGTHTGPPSSYSTQRTLSQERIRKPDRNTALFLPNSPGFALDRESSEEPIDQARSSASEDEGTATRLHAQRGTTEMQNTATPTGEFQGTDRSAAPRESMEASSKGSSSDERKSEDLFLNIARVDALKPPAPKSERKWSRLSLPFLGVNRKGLEANPAPFYSPIEAPQALTPSADAAAYYNRQATVGPPASQNTSASYIRDRTSDMAPDAERYSYVGKKASNYSAETVRSTQRNNSGARNHRNLPETVYPESPKVGEHMATESTVSTAAPSSVWDELDDLKSRIRKLELTGKLPSSSAAAMTSSERPRTATTAATTMSTSPQHKTTTKPFQSPMEPMPSNVHALLHEALASAEQTLQYDVYRKLHTTAQDALQLSAMVMKLGQTAPGYGNASGPDRQIIRKAESMCRGLTELAITLSAEVKSTTTGNRPGSRDVNAPPNSMLRSRRQSDEIFDRSAGLQSRLDSRRLSAQFSSNQVKPASPDRSVVQAPHGDLSTQTSARISRASTVVRNRRVPGYFDGADDEPNSSPSIRPVSRAKTEAGVYRRASASREYLHQAPMPTRIDTTTATTSTMPSGMSTNFTSRRKYNSPASVVGISTPSPATPRGVYGPQPPATGETGFLDGLLDGNSTSRAGSNRRSVGLSNRLGSTVGSRLRGSRADRASTTNHEAASNTYDGAYS